VPLSLKKDCVTKVLVAIINAVGVVEGIYKTGDHINKSRIDGAIGSFSQRSKGRTWLAATEFLNSAIFLQGKITALTYSIRIYIIILIFFPFLLLTINK
jgi:hypothetical protein